VDALSRAAAGRPRWLTGVGVVVLLGAGALLAHALGAGDALQLENLGRLQQWIRSQGPLAPAIYVAGYGLGQVVLVPALPLTVLGGIAFGPLWGTIYASLGSTLGAALAYLTARHAARGLVERWLAGNPRFARIDRGVARHGWRVLMVTRLVPLFPFVLQSFAYGLTAIRFWPYVGITWACSLPGTFALVLAGNALVEGRGDVGRTLAWIAGAGVLIVLISLVPRWLLGRTRVAGDLVADLARDRDPGR
jgi:uncharacterized membrane protein YdjX (TVP38/TMEM64 family)